MIVTDICKQMVTYEGLRELRVSAAFPEGEVSAICGPSGAGKTTLLKVLAGLSRPEKGSITVNGELWLDMEKGISLSPQSRRAGFVFQDYSLFPNMTVRQHLEYGSDDRAWVDQLLVMGKMESFGSRRPQQLSGGQQQRLAILRALVTSPHVVLMDEPFSALDTELRTSLIADLGILLAETRSTCLIVTHNPAELSGLTSFTLDLPGIHT